MIVAVYVALAASALFGVAAPGIARRLPPAVATWLLTVGGAVAAGAWVTSLALLAFTLVGQDSLFAAYGHWSGAALSRSDPVAAPVAAAALVVSVICAVRTAAAATVRLGAVRRAHAVAAQLPAPGGELAVIDDPAPLACTVPGRPGRIVLSTGLLRTLDPDERRAVLDHERTHLRHRHHLHRTVTHLAAVANPLLWRLPDAAVLAGERWADEVAAARCPDRAVVVAALARIARHCGGPSARSAVVLSAGVEHLADRVRALRLPPPRLRPDLVAAAALLLAVAVFATVDAAHDAEGLLDVAQGVYRLRHR